MGKARRDYTSEMCAPLKALFEIRNAKQQLGVNYAVAQRNICDDYRLGAKKAAREYRAKINGLKAEKDNKRAKLDSERKTELIQLERKECHREIEAVNAYTKNPVDNPGLYDLAVGIVYNRWAFARGDGRINDEAKFAEMLVEVHRAADEKESALNFLQEGLDDSGQKQKQIERKLKRTRSRKERKRLKAEYKSYETMERTFIALAEEIEADMRRSAESGLISRVKE